jgi:glycosyltransferase involved in cell wall biosynthesis
MLISVVIATYNRSNVLRYAIESVRWQTLTDWELIVVGDACTDDTAEVVASFGDPRIRFVNRAENFGEQSAANNDGVALARGRYIAFLNHDDLWRPGHLAACVSEIESSGADLVFTEPLQIRPDGISTLGGSTSAGSYEPWMAVPASAWLFRRELADVVGPWRAARDHFAVPSQDWLYRAWRLGGKLIAVPRITMVVIASSSRRGSYSERHEDEHAFWMKRLCEEPDAIEKALASIAIRTTAENADGRVLLHVGRAMKNALRRLSMMLGVPMHAARNAVLFRRRGGSVDRARETRGLPPLPRREAS